MTRLPSTLARTVLGFAFAMLAFAAQAQTTHDVTISGLSFSPSNVVIAPGDTVRWTNNTGITHDVTADNGSFNSATAANFTFSQTFNNAGSVPYHCTVHGSPGSGMTGTVTIQGGATFDLSLTEVSANNDVTYSPGDPLPLEAEVTNVGTGGSTAYMVSFYLSTDNNITSGDTLLGSVNRNALGAGNDDNFNVNFNLPGNTAAGSYFVGAIIDVSDANNGNNSNFEDESILVIGAPAAADLALQSVNAPSGPFEQGQLVTVQSTITNLGGTASTPYTLTFYASADNVIEASDTEIGVANRTALGAGATHNNPVDVTIPVNLPEGQYFIGAIITGGDSSPGNNSNVDAVSVTIVASTGLSFVINSGLNDSWWNAATPGQGFFITVFPDDGSIFLAWFTYDTERPDPSVTAILGEPGHRWLTAFGNYASNLAQLEIELTEGGVFNTGDPAVSQSAYGSIEIEFIDCNNAIITYDIPSLGLMGVIPITRIAADNIPACLAAQPQ